MSNIFTVAIIGRPNVGKSTLFNRIIKDRLSIVDDKIGVTRDRIYSYASCLTRKFSLIDTGGITSEGIPFQEQIKIQSEVAINEANLIFFVISYKDGITDDDRNIAKFLYKSKKKVIFVINKYDNQNNLFDIYDYMDFGFCVPIPVAAEHGIGIGDLLDKLVEHMKEPKEAKSENGIKFAIIGKPNVGKSSLVNSILNEKRVIVSPVAGTTTDSIDSIFNYNKEKYIAIDTAGIRKKGKIYEKLERYSYLRSMKSIAKSDIVILLLNGNEDISDLDTNIGGLAYEISKPVIIVVNKIDLLTNEERKNIDELRKKIKNRFKYLNYSFVVFISALQNKNINLLLNKIKLVYELMSKRIQTSVLNEVLVKAQLMNPTPNFNGGRLKIYYASQPLNSMPPTFILFVNNNKYLHFSYLRFITNQIRESFAFEAVPLKLIFRSKKQGD